MKNFIKNLRVRSKLMILVGVGVLGMAVLGLLSIVFMSKINDAATEIAEKWMPLTISAEDINNYTSMYRLYEYKHTISNDATEMAELDRTLQEYKDNIQKEIDNYNGLATTQRALELIAQTENDWNEYLRISETAIATSAAGNSQEAVAILNDQAMELFNSVTDTVTELVEFNKEGSDSANAGADRLFSAALAGMLLVITVAVALCIILAIIIITVIMHPVKELETVTGKIAEGDLDAKLTYQSKDEFGVLVGNFSRTVERLQEYVDYISEISDVLENLAKGKLNIKLTYEYAGEFAKVKEALTATSSALIDTMGQIGHTADNVAASAQQLSSGSQALAEGATDQAGTVEELAATITDVTDKVSDNAKNAKEADKIVSDTTHNVDESNEKMHEMISAMEKISEKSNRIANIIATIEDIASQTNLLSLNASIEAARAGEAGKGFAVVADQVKNLAVQSADSAQNVVELVEETLQAVDEGTRIVTTTAEALEKVVSSISLVTDSVNQISEASADQAEAMKQIESGVEEISSVIQNNSATAQESAAASEELDGQSQILKQMLSKFEY